MSMNGFGKFGFLTREYTDVRLGRYFNWETRIDGIEIFESYITQLQREIYDNIYVGNAIDILPTLGNYDVIICSDVLEHLSEKDGVFLLNTVKEKSKFVEWDKGNRKEYFAIFAKSFKKSRKACCYTI